MTIKETLINCWPRPRSLRIALVLLLCPLWLFPQFSSILTLQTPPTLALKAGTEVSVKLHVRLNAGYHVNSTKPTDQYLIPLKLTWTAEPVEVSGITFPEPVLEKYPFSEKPLSVYTSSFDIVAKLKAPATAPKGEKTLTAKMRYQACSNTACYPPRTAEAKVTVNIY